METCVFLTNTTIIAVKLKDNSKHNGDNIWVESGPLFTEKIRSYWYRDSHYQPEMTDYARKTVTF